MRTDGELAPIVILGGAAQTGAYVLRVAVRAPLALAFGRFRGGEAIRLPAGDYAYVGSAMGAKGAASLARRLLRHATRTGARPPHAIRPAMLARFAAVGLGGVDLKPAPAKRLHWHVDYLLDQTAAEITHAIALRTADRLEAALARLLHGEAEVSVVAAGLGASDARGGAHLLRVTADEAWWRALPAKCARVAQGGAAR
ncbi:MAG: GIY-YIG nuclease family protein [Anaerolineae bacterium]|nr:GIY-YIG nuclease family protein [Anaerolineae bacterium]